MNEIRIEISDIYIPMKRRNSLDLERVTKLANDILEHGLTMPILVRRDETRFVLVEGLHRLEACKALGERTIKALVAARQSRWHYALPRLECSGMVTRCLS